MSGNFDNPALENGPKTGSFASDQKERHQSNRQISGTCWPQQLFVLPTAVVSPDPLFPTPSTSSAVKTPENIEEGPDDPEASDEGDIQMEYSCCVAQLQEQ